MDDVKNVCNHGIYVLKMLKETCPSTKSHIYRESERIISQLYTVMAKKGLFFVHAVLVYFPLIGSSLWFPTAPFISPKFPVMTLRYSSQYSNTRNPKKEITLYYWLFICFWKVCLWDCI